MDRRLSDILNGKGENYILPFFWQHGEHETELREEMRRIHESGIAAVCVESRPHPDFAGPGWWRDMDIIMDEARKRNMKVWVLDDAHFPTGFANGWIKDKYPEKGKLYLDIRYIDAYGPLRDASIIIDGWLNPDDRLLAVIASKTGDKPEDIDGTLLDITRNINGGTLYWDIPEGFWKIFIIFVTKKGGGRTYYINPIDRESVRVLIDAVYEPHYSHYRNDFGKTFAGFFSDEAEMGNTEGYDFDESIGRKRMALPWSRDLPGLLCSRLGQDYKRYLPCLWYNADGFTARVRFTYMDIITRLFSVCFTGQIGEWCRSRGVKYIGHVIEDANVHTRLGCGAGHFFRALGGQDMSGADVVLQQILPGFDRTGHQWIGCERDGEFFHYALAKMASSLGHLDPLKKGRTICEIFGAYGWMEGLKLMKWLTDHMLVRGINLFVPHAFSPHEFPDPDCPPHLYAGGRNPQFRYLGLLMKYTNRLCHLLSGGLHVAPAAVLYHAEAEWSGRYMEFQKPVRELLRRQIDCDIISSDVLADMDSYGGYTDKGRLFINGEMYSCLIVPYSQYVTSAVARFAALSNENGFTTVFIDMLPEGICDKEDPDKSRCLLDSLKACKVVCLGELVNALYMQGIYEIKAASFQPYLRYYHYKRDEADIFMFFNEHPHEEINTTADIPLTGNVSFYDAFENTLSPAATWISGEHTKVRLKLAPYESLIAIFGSNSEESALKADTAFDGQPNVKFLIEGLPEDIILNGPWMLSLSSAAEYPRFTFKMTLARLENISAAGLFPYFSGTMRYETVFDFIYDKGPVVLDLSDVYETAEVWINDAYAGIRICPPYLFNIGKFLKQGKNMLRVEVTNTLVREQRDEFSRYAALEPSGLIGPVTLCYGHKKAQLKK